MQLFRARLKLEGPLASPLASGMIFGQLCWMLHDVEGEKALQAWLAEPDRLWGVSDAFPAEHLPRPILVPRAVEPRQIAGDHKALRRRTLITREGFLRLRPALGPEAVDGGVLRDPADRLHRTARNSVDRHTGRARDEAGLFFRDEVWPAETAGAGQAAGVERDLYVEAPAEDVPRIERLLRQLGAAGFGKAAGLGRGQFRVLGIEAERQLGQLAGASRFMSLSRGTITANMADTLCRLEPHFGKTGARIAVGEGASPFKRPLLLTRAGATFTRSGEGRFGDWLTGVHPTRPEIGHNAFHVAIPFAETGHA